MVCVDKPRVLDRTTYTYMISVQQILLMPSNNTPSSVSWTVPTFPRFRLFCASIYDGLKLLFIGFFVFIGTLTIPLALGGVELAVLVVIIYALFLHILVYGIGLYGTSASDRSSLFQTKGIVSLLYTVLPIGSAREFLRSMIAAGGILILLIVMTRYTQLPFMTIFLPLLLLTIPITRGSGGTAHIDLDRAEFKRTFDRQGRFHDGPQTLTLRGLKRYRAVSIGSVTAIWISGGQAGLSGPGVILLPTRKREAVVSALETLQSKQPTRSQTDTRIKIAGVLIAFVSVAVPIGMYLTGADRDLIGIVGYLSVFGVFVGLLIAAR